MNARDSVGTDVKAPARRGGGLAPPVAAVIAIAYVAHNFAQLGVHPMAIGRALVVAAVLGVLLQLVATLVLRDRNRGAAAAAGLTVFIILWGPISTVVAAAIRLEPWQLGILALLVVGLAVLAVRLATSIGVRPTAHGASRAFSAFAFALSGVVILEVLFSPVLGQVPADLFRTEPPIAAAGLQGPDIYVVIVDGHPRADALLEQTGKDISPFTAELEVRGFTVAGESHSNYTWTAASLTSMFQMRHLADDPAGDALLNGNRSRELNARIALTENAAFDELHRRGYEVVGIRPPHEHATIRTVDRFIDPGYVNTFECHLLRETLIGSLAWLVDPGLVYDAQRAAVLRTFDELSDLAAEPGGPRFVFAHLPVPHLPVMWDGNGGEVNDPTGSDCTPKEAEGLGRDDLVAAYDVQLDYLHSVLLDGLDDLAAAADEDAVIVVISDHGASVGAFPDEPYDERKWRDQFANLVAARTPGQEGVLGEDISLVNLLPSLFNAYFGTELPMQSDTTFVSEEGAFHPVAP